eukprot:1162143-Pelagomonas_calceolata.AAC.37
MTSSGPCCAGPFGHCCCCCCCSACRVPIPTMSVVSMPGAVMVRVRRSKSTRGYKWAVRIMSQERGENVPTCRCVSRRGITAEESPVLL